MKKILLAAGLLFLAGCEGTPVKPERVENVVRLMRSNNSYIVLVEDQKTKELKERSFHECNDSVVRLFSDCPNDKAMWLTVEQNPNRNMDGKRALVTIHVHSGRDVDGGATGGKFPNKNQVVE